VKEISVGRRRTARRSELTQALDREGRRTGSLGTLHARAIAEATGVHWTDFEALDVLDWTGPITAGELARRVGLTSGAITGVIDRLERDGWVRRARDPADRRKVIVEMVPGRIDVEQQAAMFAPLVADIEAVSERFDDDQLAAILDYLRSCNDAVERSTARLRAHPTP
jgi:DNA-binding MarR family transcriptional regulator